MTQRFLRRIAIVDLAQMKVVGQLPVGKSPHGVFMLKGTLTTAALAGLARPSASAAAEVASRRMRGLIDIWVGVQAWIFETFVSPVLYALGLMEWYEPAFNAVEFVMLGVVQIP